MNYRLLAASVILVLASALPNLQAAPLQKKVLIIGVDGTMSQYLAVAATPNLNALKPNGVFTDRAVTAPVTHSASCWSSMFTGVWGDKSLITRADNTMTPNRFDLYPSFMKRLETVNSNLNTVAYLRWCDLQYALAGTDVVTCYNSDAEIVTATCNRLTNSNPDVFFTILLDVDSAGHSPGWGTPTYVSAIETADAHIGQIMNALTNRTTFTNEDWLVIILADHGEHDAAPDLARLVFHLVWGQSAARGPYYPIPSEVDVCATVLTHMGVAIDPAWNLDARVEGLPLPPLQYGTNLIFNGDGESNSGTNGYQPDRGIAWWVDYAGTTLGMYDANTNFLSATNAGPSQRGRNFFLGGTNRTTWMSQTIDASSLAGTIDGPGVNYQLAGWLGGSGAESNSALFYTRFLTASNALLGSNYIGPVTHLNRGGVASLLARSTNGVVPPGTRLIEFTLNLNSASTNNNASADNLSFVLTPRCTNSYQVAAQTAGGGTVLTSPNLGSFPCGASVTNLAIPEEGWSFLGWIGDWEGTNSAATIGMDSDKCIEAIFGTRFLVLNNVDGTVTLTPTNTRYAYGELVSALALPSPGYYFAEWTGIVTGSNNPVNFAIYEADTLLAPVFLPLPEGQFTITTAIEGKGSVTVEPLAGYYEAGTLVTNTALARPGQVFLGWGGDTNGCTAADNMLMVPADTNRIIRAYFTAGPALQLEDCFGGSSRLSVSGAAGERYVLQRATWLDASAPTNGNWVTLGVMTNTLGKVIFRDTGAPLGNRFYRALVNDQ